MSESSKSILVCITDYLPHIGGAELAVHEIAKRLSQEGYVFELITARIERKLPHYEYIGGVHVYRVGFGFWGDKFLLPITGLFRYLSCKRRPYDAIWSMMASQGSVLATFVSFFSKSPLLLTLQEGDEETHLARYVGGSRFLYNMCIKPWHKLVFKRAKRITAISTYLKERAQIYSNAPIDIIPNGVTLTDFEDASSEQVDLIKQKYDLNGKKVVLSVSRLVQKNNIAILIRALTHVPQDTVLVVVGEGEERNSLELLVRARALEDRVIFVGKVPHGNIPNYMHASHVFARTSLSEGLGSVFLEAFAAGIPVLTSPVGGIVDIVKDNETGFLVSPHDEEEVARKIVSILEDDVSRMRVVQNATEVVKKYSWDNIATDMSISFGQL